MKLRSNLLKYILILLFIFGCAKAPEEKKETTLSEANEKFIKICKEEGSLDVILTPLKNTLWVYIPMEHPFFEYKADDNPVADTSKHPEHYAINFLDSTFKDTKFVIEYDIIKEKFYPNDYGFSSKNTDEFAKKNRFIFNALSRAYFELGEKDENISYSDYDGKEEDQPLMKVPKEHIPEFFVFVFADVKSGIEYKMTMNLDDYKKSSMGLYPYEEYSIRIISDMKGNKEIINDYKGTHLDYKEVLLPDFLAAQIKNRITFKLTKSDFPPGENIEAEILKQAAITVKTYDFKDFEGITTINLRKNTTNELSKDGLYKLDAEPATPQGKIHVIHFN